MQLFSETHSKRSQGLVKRLSFLKTLQTLTVGAQKTAPTAFLWDVLPDRKLILLSWNSLFPLIAVPSVFLIKSHILFWRDMGASNKVQLHVYTYIDSLRYYAALQRLHYIFFQGVDC